MKNKIVSINKNNLLVGMVTFHNVYNYGGMLQAYALQTYIKSLGYNVKL